MHRALKLLGKDKCVGDKSESSLSPVELYFLVLSILFHDVGNVFSRKGHKSKLAEAYEFCRGTGQEFLQERRNLFAIIEAHGGQDIPQVRMTPSDHSIPAPFSKDRDLIANGSRQC